MTDVRSYYGGPVLAEPVWTWEIPVYFFVGGLGGASAALSLAADGAGNQRLARRSELVALTALAASPALLISDLGRPVRFLNMLRMFKPTSPMSVGSWVLAGGGAMTAATVASRATGVLPRAGEATRVAAGLLGLPISTYTATLISNTAIPIWHGARRTLPFLFAAGAAASAGAAAVIACPPSDAAPARRLAIGGVAAELALHLVMERRLGDLGEPYRERGPAARYAKLGRALSVAGAAAIAGARGRRGPAIAGGAATLAGALCERLSVFKAGFASARDPRYTVGPQRARLEQS